MRRTRVSVLLAVLSAGLLSMASCSSPNSAPPASAASTPSSPGTPLPFNMIAADLPPLPLAVANAARPVAVVKAAYEFAARHPEVLTYVPCFCGCERGGHKGNNDCFVKGRDATGHVTAWEEHGMGCEICVDVAQMAMQMHDSGASVEAIRDAVEQRFAGPDMGHTPTPMPPHSAGGH